MTKNALLKGGEFLIRQSNCQDVFTPEDFTEEQIMMRDTVKDFVDREIVPVKKRFEEHDYNLTQEILKKAGQLGLLGVAVPEAYQGMGMDFVSSMLVTDYFSGATGSAGTAFGAHTGIGTLPIVLYGTAEQKQKYLPQLATGEWFGAYALTEPSAGSDANSGKTKAVRSDDGKHYLISGQKMWISNSGFAHTFIVFARIEDDKYLSAFIVEYDKSAPNGITLGEEEQKLGIHSSSTRQVFFDNTKVPVENMLATRNKGFKIAMNILNIGRIRLAAACLDAQRRVISQAVIYANERQQFKQKIADFEAIKGKLAIMATRAYVGESAVYRLAHLIELHSKKLQAEKELSPEAAKLKAVENFAVECSLLKVSCSEDSQDCADEGLQIFGGIGYSKDCPMEAAWRDARIPRIYEGTNEINRMHAVGMLLKKALKGKLDLLSATKAVQNELTAIPDFNQSDDTSPLGEEKRLVENLKKLFLMVAGSAVKEYSTQLTTHQHVLMDAADILIATYNAESVVLRVEKLLTTQSQEQAKAQIAMAQLAVYRAVQLSRGKAENAIVSMASGDKQKMLLLGLKRFTKQRHYPNVADIQNTIADRVIAANAYCF